MSNRLLHPWTKNVRISPNSAAYKVAHGAKLGVTYKAETTKPGAGQLGSGAKGGKKG